MKKYLEPSMEIVTFSKQDVLVVSDSYQKSFAETDDIEI